MFCLVQELKNQAAAAAKQSSKKGAKVSDATQKEALKGLQTTRSTASKYLENAKKEANTQYQNAQARPNLILLFPYIFLHELLPTLESRNLRMTQVGVMFAHAIVRAQPSQAKARRSAGSMKGRFSDTD